MFPFLFNKAYLSSFQVQLNDLLQEALDPWLTDDNNLEQYIHDFTQSSNNP